ncbi:MAG: biopolymer transporter ExbD [bacterium]
MIDFKDVQKNKASEVNITPMIDIIFNLLIFFLITAVISQKGMNLKLPESSTAEKRSDESLEITVTKDEDIIFNGEKIEKSDVKRLLLEEKNRDSSEKASGIVLKSDAEAPFGMFVYVMDVARGLGLENLVIATEIPREDEN